MDKQNQFF